MAIPPLGVLAEASNPAGGHLLGATVDCEPGLNFLRKRAGAIIHALHAWLETYPRAVTGVLRSLWRDREEIVRTAFTQGVSADAN